MSTLAINQPGSLTESARHLCRVLAGYSPSELRQRLGITPPPAEDTHVPTSTELDLASEPGADRAPTRPAQ